MDDRPGSFRYATQSGIVVGVHPESWEVDVLLARGGVVERAVVMGPRLPEVSTRERPQYVMVDWIDAQHAMPIASPVASRVGGTRRMRSGFRYFEEFYNYRITEDHQGTLEIESQREGKQLTVRVKESSDEIEIEGKGGQHVRIRLGLDGNILIEADKAVDVTCQTASVTAVNTVDVKCQQATVDADILVNITAPLIGVNADAAVGVTAPQITLSGAVTIDGTLAIP